MKQADQVETRYVPGLPFDTYRTIGRGKKDQVLVVNASILKKGTALEMKAALYDEDEDVSKVNEACVLGNTVHHAVLEPECMEAGEFDKHYCWCPTAGLNTRAAQKAKRMNKGLILTNEAIVEDAKRMRDSIMKHDFARHILENSWDRELTGIAYDKDFGIVRKIRIDATGGDGVEANGWAPWIADIKTVRPDRFQVTAFASECRRNGYGIQFPYYLDTDEMITGRRRDHVYVIAVQNKAPFMTRVFEVTHESLEIGRELYRERLGMLCTAHETKQWEGFEHENPCPQLEIYKQIA